MNTIEIKNVLEAALLCSSEPLSMIQLRKLFNDEFNAELLRPLLDELALDWDDRSVELASVASGWRFQSKPQYAMFINRLTPEKAPKYSRAVMETLAIIAYRQPVTRGDIEEIRGVSVGSQIVKTLEDRGWIDVIGHKEVPGRPALFATTKQFLDDLNLLSIKELPPIDEMGGEESADFFGQVTEALEADGASDPGSEDLASPEQSEPGAQEGDSPSQELGVNGDPVVSSSASSSDAEVVSEPISELHLESGDAQEQAGDGDRSGPDAANDQDGADVPVVIAALAASDLSQELDVADSVPDVASDPVIQVDEPGIQQEAQQAAHQEAREATEDVASAEEVDALEAVDAIEAIEAPASEDDGGYVEPLVRDDAPVEIDANSEQITPTEPISNAEPMTGLAPTEVSADGEFFAAATAEAVAALSDSDDVVSDGAASDSSITESPVSESPVRESARPTPGVLKPSGLAVDDPNLEQVDWPDLPSLDGLDDAAQEPSEQTSEQDPPGGESEPVESR